MTTQLALPSAPYLMFVARPAPARNRRQHPLAGPNRMSGRAHARTWGTPQVIMSPQRTIAARTEISLGVHARARRHERSNRRPVNGVVTMR